MFVWLSQACAFLANNSWATNAKTKSGSNQGPGLTPPSLPTPSLRQRTRNSWKLNYCEYLWILVQKFKVWPLAQWAQVVSLCNSLEQLPSRLCVKEPTLPKDLTHFMSIGNIWNMLGILTTKCCERQWQEFLSLILWSKHCMIFWLILIDIPCLRALSFSICLMYSLSLCWICESEICSRFQWQYQGRATRQVKLKRCEYQSSCPVPCAKRILHIFGLTALCRPFKPIVTTKWIKRWTRMPPAVWKTWVGSPRTSRSSGLSLQDPSKAC